MSMKPKLRLIGLGLAALSVVLTSGAYAYWILGVDHENAASSIDIGAASGIDDIKENYAFGKTASEVKEYTMYVFPSTVYYDLYCSSEATGVLPEDAFGYLEPTIDDTNNAVLDADGNPTFTVHYEKTDGSANAGNGKVLQDGDPIDEDSYLEFSKVDNNGEEWDPSTGYRPPYVQNWNWSGYGVNFDSGWNYLTLSPTYTVENAQPDANDPYLSGETFEAYVDAYGDDDKERFACNDEWSWKIGDPDADEEVDPFFTDNVDAGATVTGKYYVDPSDSSVKWVNTKGTYKGPYTFSASAAGDAAVTNGRFCFRNHHFGDRYGYWNYLNYKEGRFLPIKLSFTNALDIKLYCDIVLNPWSDMSDSNRWFNFSFQGFVAPTSAADRSMNPIVDYSSASSQWRIFNFNEDSGDRKAVQSDYDNEKVQHQKDAFSSADRNDLFDPMVNIANYADENGVIRLFPTFSNGKNGSFTWDAYKYLDGNNEEQDGISAYGFFQYGTFDSIKMDYRYKGGNNDAQGTNDDYPATKNVPERYAVHHHGRYTNTYQTSNATWNGKNRQVRVSSFDSFRLEDDYDSILFRVAQVIVPSQFYTYWEPVMGLTGETIRTMIDTYGSGLYNFYVFECYDYREAEYTGIKDNDWWPSTSVYRSDASDFHYAGTDDDPCPTGALNETLDDVISSGSFPELNGKKLKFLTSNATPQNFYTDKYGNENPDFTLTSGFASSESEEVWITSAQPPVNYTLGAADGYYSNPVSRCFAVGFEKVVEAKIAKDFATGSSEEEMEANISDALEDSDTFYKEEDVAFADVTTDDDGNMTTEYTPIEANPYMFKLDGVDFTNDDEIDFQIRLSENYDSEIIYDLDGVPKSSSASEKHESVVINYSSGKTDYLQSERLVCGSNYFETQTVNGQQVLKIKPKSAGGDPKSQAGIYDILIIRDNTFDVSNQTKYFVYAYRHTNIFVKIMLYDVKQDSAGFAIHNSSSFGTFSDSTSASDLADSSKENWIIYNHSYFLGQHMGDNDYQELGSSGEAETRNDKTEIDEAIGRLAQLQGKTKTKYYIRDHVTGLLVGWYDATGALQLNLTIKKNYVLFLGYNDSGA